MKRFISLALIMLLLVTAFGISSLAQEPSVTVYVTIANKGELVVVLDKITVTDIDGDGNLTINDALYLAHEANYDEGADKGYASANTDYGLSMTKLWGDVSGSYGYYHNNSSAWSLLDTVKDGDSVYAFVYADGTGWSDAYSFFNQSLVDAKVGEAIELNLSISSYDENWNPVTLALSDAVITVDGVKTEIKTDSNGKASVVMDKTGTVVISAKSDNMTIVPPVCVLNVKSATSNPETTPETSDKGNVYVVLAVASLSVALISIKKRIYEN